MRGLGHQQQEQRTFTESKIVAYLSIRPLTSEELYKRSRIDKHTLFTRLESLLARRILIKHKYGIPFDARNYPDIFYFRDELKPRARFGKFYYLLDWSNQETKDLLQYYYQCNRSQVLCRTLKRRELIEKDFTEYGFSKDEIDFVIKLSEDDKTPLGKIPESYVTALEETEKKKLAANMKEVDRMLELAEFVATELDKGNLHNLEKKGLMKDPRESVAEIVIRRAKEWKWPAKTRDFVMGCLPYLLSNYYGLNASQLKRLGKDLMKKYITEMMGRNIAIFREEQDCKYLLIDHRSWIGYDLSYLEDPETIQDIARTVKYFMKSTGSVFDVLIRLTTDTVNGLFSLPSLDFIQSHIELWDVLSDKKLLGL